MPVVSNTSPVIALAQIRRLTLFRELYGSLLIPPFVKTECVDQGKVIGAPDVHEIEKGIQEGWIVVETLAKRKEQEAERLMERARLGRGEAEAIVLAKARQLPVILDDAEARAVARSLGLDYMGTLMLPYQAFVRRILSREELVESLTGLSRVLWVSPEVIAEVLRRAEEVKR